MSKINQSNQSIDSSNNEIENDVRDANSFSIGNYDIEPGRESENTSKFGVNDTKSTYSSLASSSMFTSNPNSRLNTITDCDGKK